MPHIPVLLNEVMRLLDPKPGEFLIDGTVDGCGYTRMILERLQGQGNFLGVDWDKKMVDAAKENIRPRGVNVFFAHDNFANLPGIIHGLGLGKADGIVLDLGFSSIQLEDPGRGFSFMKNEPLLMTYSDDETPVKEILRNISYEELTTVIREFGEERFAGRIAKAIKEAGRKKKIETTKELADIVARAVPKNYERGRINPATRTFQAMRIYANKELENLESILKNMMSILKSGGRAVIVSFHSLEDRLVKNYFRDFSKAGTAEILTKKPITAGAVEIQENPRSRSAKLRAIAVE